MPTHPPLLLSFPHPPLLPCAFRRSLPPPQPLQVTGLVQLQQALLAKVESLSTSVAAPCLNASSMAAAANAGVSALGRGQTAVQEQVASLAASQQQLLTMMCDVKEELLSLQACPIPHVVTTPRASCDTPTAATGAHAAPAAAAAAAAAAGVASSSKGHAQLPLPATVQLEPYHHHKQHRDGGNKSSSSSASSNSSSEGCYPAAARAGEAAPTLMEADLLEGACDIESYSSACSLRRRSIRAGVDAAVDAAVQSVFT